MLRPLGGAAARGLTFGPGAGAGAGAGRWRALGGRPRTGRRRARLRAGWRRALLRGRRRRPVDAAHGQVTQARHAQLARQLPEVQAAAGAQPDHAGHEVVGNALVVSERHVHLCRPGRAFRGPSLRWCAALGAPPLAPLPRSPSKMVDRSDSTLSMGGLRGSMCSQGSFFTSFSFHLVSGLPGVCKRGEGGRGGGAVALHHSRWSWAGAAALVSAAEKRLD